MKNSNWSRLAALITISALIFLAACNRNSSGGDLMASINGRKIYRTEVDKYYANQTAGSDQQPAGEQAVSLRLSILNELIESRDPDAARRETRLAGDRRRSRPQG